MDELEQGKLESLEKRVGELDDFVLDIYEGFVLGYVDDLDQASQMAVIDDITDRVYGLHLG